MPSTFFSNNFRFLLQQSTIKLFIHFRELPLLLRANLQLPPSADMGPEIGTSHGHLQGPNLLQLSCARLLRDLPAASEGPADKAEGDIPGRGFRHQRPQGRFPRSRQARSQQHQQVQPHHELRLQPQ